MTLTTSIRCQAETDRMRGRQPAQICRNGSYRVGNSSCTATFTHPDALVPVRVHQTIGANPYVIARTAFLDEVKEFVVGSRRRKQQLLVSAAIEHVVDEARL